MTPRLSFHPLAQREIADATAWYERRSPGLGRTFLGAIDDVLEVVVAFPLRFREVRPGYRRVLVRRFPYAIIFEVVPGSTEIRVLECHHQRRRPGRWRGRR